MTKPIQTVWRSRSHNQGLSQRSTLLYIMHQKATVKLIGKGTETFQGVIWANGLDIRGTSAIPTIPKTVWLMSSFSWEYFPMKTTLSIIA